MKNSWLLIVVSMMLLLASCKSKYERLLKEELASGEVFEDLILGLKMGQTKKEFYGICWELNSQGLISQGPSNENVRYSIPEGDIPNETQKVDMLFFGIFDDEKIMRGITQRFFYVAWAPWNDDLQADKLLEKLKQYYLEKYDGNDFIEIDLGVKDIKSYVKIDGNRQLVMYPVDEKEVMVKIEDTRYKFGNND